MYGFFHYDIIIMEEAIHVIVQLIPVAALKWELHSDTKLILQKY